ncbi:MAG: hypothetical protein V2A77_10560, partial [Pseudomonadota bacterium]
MSSERHPASLVLAHAGLPVLFCQVPQFRGLNLLRYLFRRITRDNLPNRGAASHGPPHRAHTPRDVPYRLAVSAEGAPNIVAYIPQGLPLHLALATEGTPDLVEVRLEVGPHVLQRRPGGRFRRDRHVHLMLGGDL